MYINHKTQKNILALLLVIAAIAIMAKAPQKHEIQTNLLERSTQQTHLAQSGAIQKKANETRLSARVVRVVDGDTITVNVNGDEEKVRFIGINTPESVDPRSPVQCFGLEASTRTKQLLDGKKIFLEADPSQTDRDKYNRLLRYVFLEDGTNINLELIQEGYAHEYTYDVPYRYQKQFKQAQKDASNAKIGLWADDACA